MTIPRVIMTVRLPVHLAEKVHEEMVTQSRSTNHVLTKAVTWYFDERAKIGELHIRVEKLEAIVQEMVRGYESRGL